MKNLQIQIEEQATTIAAMKEDINYKKKQINVACQKSKILDESLKKSHLTNQNVLKALVERDIFIGITIVLALYNVYSLVKVHYIHYTIYIPCI